jgi:hypothetical protein
MTSRHSDSIVVQSDDKSSGHRTITPQDIQKALVRHSRSDVPCSLERTGLLADLPA